MTESVIGEFLKDHPEYIPDARWLEVEGRPELCLSTDGVIAFADWTIATGRGDAAKARRFREMLRKRYGR